MWFIFPLDDVFDEYNTYLAALIELGCDHEIVLGSLMSVMSSYADISTDKTPLQIYDLYMSGMIFNELADVFHDDVSGNAENAIQVTIQLVRLLIEKEFHLCEHLFDIYTKQGGSIYYNSTSGRNLIFWIDKGI